jgi:hypothetical protein
MVPNTWYYVIDVFIIVIALKSRKYVQNIKIASIIKKILQTVIIPLHNSVGVRCR